MPSRGEDVRGGGDRGSCVNTRGATTRDPPCPPASSHGWHSTRTRCQGQTTMPLFMSRRTSSTCPGTGTTDHRWYECPSRSTKPIKCCASRTDAGACGDDVRARMDRRAVRANSVDEGRVADGPLGETLQHAAEADECQHTDREPHAPERLRIRCPEKPLAAGGRAPSGPRQPDFGRTGLKSPTGVEPPERHKRQAWQAQQKAVVPDPTDRDDGRQRVQEHAENTGCDPP